MFVQVRSIFLVAFVMISISSGVEAQSISSAIQQVDKSRDASCRASQQSLADLVFALERAADANAPLTEIADGIEVLSREEFWKSTDQRRSLEALAKLGGVKPELQPALAEAIAAAHGEVRHILFSKRENAPDVVSALEKLISINESLNTPNRFYVAQIKLTIASYLSELAYSNLNASDASVPLTSTQVRSIDVSLDGLAGVRSKLNLSIDYLTELSNFFEKEFVSGVYSRNTGLDFRYQIVLMKYIVGDDQWALDLETLANYSSLDEQFTSLKAVDHVYVHNFLVTPLISETAIASTDESSGCKPEHQSAPLVPNERKNSQVRRFFNPIQLSLFTCGVLSAPGGHKSLFDLSAQLLRFKNSDYRVVLGHFRGDEVRFSYLSKDELFETAKSAIESIDATSVLARVDQTGSCTLDIDGSAISPDPSFLGVQETSKSSGYIFVGNYLNFTEARRLRDLVREFGDLEEAYLIRPQI